MIAGYRPLLIAILFYTYATAMYSAGSARQYELAPIRDGLDLTRGDKRILVMTPKGWQSHSRGVLDYTVGFTRNGRGNYPIISIEANHIGRHNQSAVTPKNSYMGVNLDTGMIGLEHIESFDAGANGRAKVWRFHTYNRHYLLALIVQPDSEGRTEVDVYLSGKDPAQLMRYLNSLKEVARFIRIVSR